MLIELRVPEPRLDVEHEGHVAARKREFDALARRALDRARLAHGRAALREREQLRRERFAARVRLRGEIEMRAGFVRGKAARELDVAVETAEQIVEVVRDAGGEHA